MVSRSQEPLFVRRWTAPLLRSPIQMLQSLGAQSWPNGTNGARALMKATMVPSGEYAGSFAPAPT